MQRLNALIDSRAVHIDDVLPLGAVRFFDSVLEIFNGVINRDNIGEFEESGLHNHIETPAETEFARDFDSVDGVDVDIIVDDVFFHSGFKFFT